MDREALKLGFIEKHGWGGAEIRPLSQDASFRQYLRLIKFDDSIILMDAPPQYESTAPFVKITRHLKQLGITVPEIIAHDPKNGFILLEDMGDDTFSRLLDSGAKALPLYQKAIITLGELQNHADATAIKLPKYDFKPFIDEANLFINWYLPGARKTVTDQAVKQHYIDAWKIVFNNLPEIEPTLVLRDYHVDNLMIYNQKCVVLDYQDAMIGSPAYDVVSLLEDARRDISTDLSQKILTYYFNINPRIDRNAFEQHYHAWGAQRHCKVLGIFTRLWLRDNKPIYLKHLSRVMSLLEKTLKYSALAPIYEWFEENDINTTHNDFTATREQLIQ